MDRKKGAFSKKSRKMRKRVVRLEKVPSSRLRFVFLIFCISLFGLSSRMAWLQILQASALEAKARSSQIHLTKPLGIRRSIVDRNGRLLALDEERFRLWAHPNNFRFPGDDPSLIRKPIDVARKLSGLIAMPMSDIIELLGDRPSGIRLVDSLDRDTALQIKRLGISGLDLNPYPQRVYPQGSLFGNVIGFLNNDRIPQAGLEQSRNSYLVKYEQPRFLRRGADGTPLPDDLAPGVFLGDDLRLELTLDVRLQEIASKSLTEQVKNWKADKGVAIVMNANNGELLALASTPTYDPNEYWKFPSSLYKEWSVQDVYEPGSTFKPINLALALQENVISTNSTVDDNGVIRIGGWPIRNHDLAANGIIDYPKVLQVSSNVAMVKTMKRLEPSTYWNWLQRLGIDISPQTDLPGAAAGFLKSKSDFISHPIEQATASYGQGFSLTPLKLVQLHALIANGGYLVSPHITKGLGGMAESLNLNSKKDPVQLLNEDVTSTIRKWMETVVLEGSGKNATIPGYRIGGKTGTAEKAVNGFYKSGAKICSFVANFPLEDPKYVVLVVVDEPKGANAYGSNVALPVAKEIIHGLLVIEKIPPSSNRTEFHPAKG